MTTELKGGHLTGDQRLDRIPQFDPKSRDFQARTLLAAVAGSRTAAAAQLQLGQPLGQRPRQRRGLCRPRPRRPGRQRPGGRRRRHRRDQAQRLVPGAVQRRPDPGRVARRRLRGDLGPGRGQGGQGPGLLRELPVGVHRSRTCSSRSATWARWCWASAGSKGMDEPRPSGLVRATGAVRGGHCIRARGVRLRAQLPGETRPPGRGPPDQQLGPRLRRQRRCVPDRQDLEALLGWTASAVCRSNPASTGSTTPALGNARPPWARRPAWAPTATREDAMARKKAKPKWGKK